MKYMIIEVGQGDLRREYPLLFSENLFHMDFAKLFKNPVISAGFVTRGKSGKLECFGKSEGLAIWSRPKIDAEIINEELAPFKWQELFPAQEPKVAAAGKT